MHQPWAVVAKTHQPLTLARHSLGKRPAILSGVFLLGYGGRMATETRIAMLPDGFHLRQTVLYVGPRRWFLYGCLWAWIVTLGTVAAFDRTHPPPAPSVQYCYEPLIQPITLEGSGYEPPEVERPGLVWVDEPGRLYMAPGGLIAMDGER